MLKPGVCTGILTDATSILIHYEQKWFENDMCSKRLMARSFVENGSLEPGLPFF